jgi:carboxyl-terminal processing protease
LIFAVPALAQLSPKDQATSLASFELVWSTVRDHNPDPNLNGLDWQAVHDSLEPRVQHAKSADEVRSILREMVARLGVSHYAIIPGDLYAAVADAPAAPDSASATGIETVILDGKAVVKSVMPDSAAARAGVRSGMVLDGIDGSPLALVPASGNGLPARAVASKLNGAAETRVSLDLTDATGKAKHVELERRDPEGKATGFANLPQTRLLFESRALTGGIGYIRFNEFLDPVSLMPRFAAALKDFARAPGVVLDLRGNPGGIGVMAMGIAGYFIDEAGKQLGEMKMRDSTLKFIVFPRPETYAGRLAILLDEGSASTTEILAQGLQDLKRARIFGTRSAGAALPSDIIRLPDGDGFQYPTASYTSSGGRVLEGNGVIPDVEARQSLASITGGEDPVIDAAVEWIARP